MRFIGSVLALKFDEEPRYEAYRALFEPITLDAASAERPIQLLCPPRAPAAPAKVCALQMRVCRCLTAHPVLDPKRVNPSKSVLRSTTVRSCMCRDYHP